MREGEARRGEACGGVEGEGEGRGKDKGSKEEERGARSTYQLLGITGT